MNLIGIVLGPLVRCIVLAAVLFYGANVGRAAGDHSLVQPAPWLSGALTSAASAAQLGQQAASNMPAIGRGG